MSGEDVVHPTQISLTRNPQDARRIDVCIVHGEAPDAITIRFPLNNWVVGALIRRSDIPTGMVTVYVSARERHFDVALDIKSLAKVLEPVKSTGVSMTRGVRLARSAKDTDQAVAADGAESVQFAISRGDAFQKAGSWLSQDGWLTEMAWISADAIIDPRSAVLSAPESEDEPLPPSEPLPPKTSVPPADPPNPSHRPWWMAAVFLLAALGGMFALWQTCRLPWGPAQCRSDLRLMVIDAESRVPIGGARVAITGVAGASLITDAGGIVILTELPPGETVAMTVEQAGFHPERLSQTCCGTEPVTVALRRLLPAPAELPVLVIAADSRTPIPGAAVVVHEGSGGRERGQGVTNGDGQVTVPQQLSGMELTVSATAPAYLPGTAPPLVCCSNRPVIVELQPAPPVTADLSVQVVESGSRSAIAGAEVTARPDDGIERKAITNAAGLADFPTQMRGASFAVSAMAQGYSPGHIPPFTCCDPSAVTVELRPVVAELQLHVADAATSAPIAGAEIRLGANTATTGTGGDASFPGQDPGRLLSVSVSAPGYTPQTWMDVACCSGPPRVLPLQRALTDLRVTVIDAVTSAPIPSADVSLYAGGLLRNKVPVDNSGRAIFTQQASGAALAVAASSPGYDPASPQPVTCCRAQPEIIRLNHMRFAQGQWRANRQGEGSSNTFVFDVRNDGGRLTVSESGRTCSVALSIQLRNREALMKASDGVVCAQAGGATVFSCEAESDAVARCTAYADDVQGRRLFSLLLRRER